MNTPSLYIVVPCFNEEAVLSETTRRLTDVLCRLTQAGQIADTSRILYVDDGSHDKTWAMIEEFHAETPMVLGVKLAANSGHQNALMAGLHTACPHADIMVSIDADLQDDVEAIAEMVSKYAAGCDIVYGVRRERKTDTFFKRTTAQGFYRLMQWLGVKSVYNHADYRLMSRRAVSQLLHYHERNLFLRGIVPLIGYQTDCVYYDRAARFAGESKYPLRKMLNFAIDGITSFSVQPLRLLFYSGLLFILISLCIFVWVVYNLLAGNTVPGWSSLMLSIWFVGGCILTGMGIIGEYIGKIYIEAKGRPRFNIERTIQED